MIPVQFEIPGHGSFSVTPEFAAALSAVAQQAHDMTAFCYPDSEFPVPIYLLNAGPKLISVIREVRHATGMNLKDAKYLVDITRGPNGRRVLIGRFPMSEARKIAEGLRDAGAEVSSIPNPLELLARQAL